MAFAAGVFSRLFDFVTDKANSIKVRADRMDDELDGIATGLSTALLKDGTQTVTANIPFSGFKLTGVGDPTSAQDAATKNYVDTAATFSNTDVRGATTANITIATALNDGDTLDGLTLVDGDLILVKNQTTASQNGIYTVASSPARATGFDTWDEHVGAILNVQEGTANAGLSFRNTNNTGGTLDTTDITFEAFGGSVTRASLGLATTDSPQFAGLNVGAATDTTITRTGAGDIAVEGNALYRAGGTDVPVADGGSGRSATTAYAVICGGTTSTAAEQSIAGVGTSGQVLTSNGAGALPTFQSPGSASAATQAEQETGSSTSVFTTPGRQHFHSSAAKFWLKATANSTTIEVSYNMTSVADTATGRMTATIATDLSTADGAILVSIEADQDTADTYACSFVSPAAGSFVMECNKIDDAGDTADPADPVSWHAVGFGDLA